MAMTREDKREKNRLRAAAWRSAHPGEQNAYLKAYYERTREAQAAKKSAKYYENREERLAAQRAKYVPHPKPPNKTREEHRQSRKAYRVANRERLKATHKAYREANPVKSKAAVNAWRQANKERWYESAKKWDREHPGSYNARMAKRRADTLRATPSWCDLKAVHTIYAEAARKTKQTGMRHEVDHIVPLRGRNVCGLHVAWNMQILTRSENARKSNKWPFSEAAA